ncbi:MAG: hypothetical protein HOI23_15530 [Deltaproteobacteria bacterium]|jgi:type VI secretion system protein ImpG|nr:hypothetical protein [Deltaproteobacteria bacterium]MBT6432085.1 hypothetical protein [Deltaproteobacteria bacterium]
MKLDSELYDEFLSELELLEKFRITYSGIHPFAPVERDDQDVQRMVEALAVFSARSRLAGERSVERHSLRMFEQHFPYLLSPVPAMTMLRALPGPRFVDATDLPADTEVVIEVPRQSDGAKDPGEDRYSFRTLHPMHIVPIELKSIRMERRGNEGSTMRLGFKSQFSRNDAVGKLELFVNHLGDFVSSLLVYSKLKQSIVSASICFDEGSDNPEPSVCRVSFGRVTGAPQTARQLSLSPVERSRLAFHYPHQELFVSVQVNQTPRNWSSFEISLELDRSWPLDLRVTNETLQLGTTAIINLRRDMANPLVVDGTKDRYRIKHPEFDEGYRMHSIQGVYKLGDQGSEPILPEVVGGRGESYQPNIEGVGAKRRAFLSLQLPDALIEPVTVATEALWIQPGAGRSTVLESEVSLPDRFLEGVEWERVGVVEPSRDSGLSERVDDLLRMVALKTQRFLGREDLLFLLEALGAGKHQYFQRLLQSVASVDVKQVPSGRQASGMKFVYYLVLENMDTNLLPAVDLFFAEVLKLLQAWSIEEVVELEVDIPNLEEHFTFQTQI